MLTELLPQYSILLSQILDDLRLSLIHPPGNGHEQELEGIEHSRHLFPPIVATLRHQIVTTSRFSSSNIGPNEIEQIEWERNQATVNGDASALDRMTSDDYTFIILRKRTADQNRN